MIHLLRMLDGGFPVFRERYFFYTRQLGDEKSCQYIISNILACQMLLPGSN